MNNPHTFKVDAPRAEVGAPNTPSGGAPLECLSDMFEGQVSRTPDRLAFYLWAQSLYLC